MSGSGLQVVGVVVATSLILFVCSVTSGPPGSELPTSNMAYCLQIYNTINTYRAKHIAPALKWNRTLNEIAENLAIELVTPPVTATDPEDFEGVNYFGAVGGRPSVNAVVKTWYNESSLYDYENPGFNHNYLNFTQMVWKSSKFLGIGTASYNNFTVIIARFSPNGNIHGAFRANVIPLRKVYR